MLILGFDLGPENTALSWLQFHDNHNYTSRDWRLLFICEDTETIEHTATKTIELLDTKEYQDMVLQSDCILIESQPPNLNQKTFGMSLVMRVLFQQWLKGTRKKVELISSGLKLRLAERYPTGIERSNYESAHAYDKRVSEVAAKMITYTCCPEDHAFLETHKKKNDLTDAFLMNLAYYWFILKEDRDLQTKWMPSDEMACLAPRPRKKVQRRKKKRKIDGLLTAYM